MNTVSKYRRLAVFAAHGAARQKIASRIAELHGKALSRGVPWGRVAAEARDLADEIDRWDARLTEAMAECAP